MIGKAAVILLTVLQTQSFASEPVLLAAQTERIAAVTVAESQAKTPGWDVLQNVDRKLTVTVHRKAFGDVRGSIDRWDEKGIVVKDKNDNDISISKTEVIRVSKDTSSKKARLTK